MNRKDLTERFAAAIQREGLTVATAESLTSGLVANELGAADGASTWFRGGLIAYMDDVKFELLGVQPGPVVTADCAREMAQGVRSLLDAEVSIATTGVGGPGELEGKAPGTVFIAASIGGSIEVEEHHFEGDAREILEQAVTACMALALKMLALA